VEGAEVASELVSKCTLGIELTK